MLMARRKFLIFPLQIAVSFAVFVLLLTRVNFSEALRILLNIKVGYLAAALVLYPLGQIISVVKWRYLAKPLGVQKDFKPMVGLYFIGSFFNFFMPTSIGGDITRSLYLSSDSQKTRISFLSVLVERGSGVVSHLILASVIMLTPFGSVLPAVLRYGFPMLTVLCILFLSALPILIPPSRTKLREVICGDLIVFWKRPWIGQVAVFYSMLFHLLLVVIHWCVARSLSLPIPFAYHFITLSLASLAALLPSFNGFGVRDAVYIYLLAFVGISPTAALLFSLCWFSILIVSGFIGAIVYVFQGVNRKRAPIFPEVSHGKAEG
jgi:glycosyltransferase 2 family protein